MRHAEKLIFFLLFACSPAFAGATTSRQLDTINHSGGGSSLTVPSTGSNVISDTASQTLTNKTINASSNTVTNVSLTTGVTGVLPTGNGGVGTWTAEFTTTQCNSSTTSITLANTPVSNASVSLFLDGTLLRQGSGLDYTISSATITLATACSTGQTLFAVYTH